MNKRREEALRQLCEEFRVDVLYVFGSRADEVRVWTMGELPALSPGPSDGERLYARDEDEADEYDLYISRCAGDLVPLERERMALILQMDTDSG